MSVHAFTLADSRKATEIVIACHEAGRAPIAVSWEDGTLTLTFTPDLTAGEQTALAEVVRAAKCGLTRAERNAIEPDLATLRTYVGIANPTAAQTAAATKALIRALRVVLGD